jgi:multiple sugar transport system permease protein
VEKRYGYILLAPAFLTLAAVALYPLSQVFVLSLYEKFLAIGSHKFVAFGNYLELVTDPRFWNSLKNTLVFTFFSVGFELILGLAIALFINQPFTARGLIRAAVLLPWAIPTVVSAKMWAWIFNTDLGILNFALTALGLVPEKLNWLGQPGLAMSAAVMLDVWKTTPFAALLFLAGLQIIPNELYRAARVDGAGWWQRLWHISLPHLRPIILIVLLFRTLDALRVFDSIYVLTGGGPANSTETLSIYAYKTFFSNLDFGYGSAIAVATFVVVIVFSIGYVALLKRRGSLAG